MKKSVEEALEKWIEDHNAHGMSKDEAACKFMLEIINDTAFADESFKTRLLKAVEEYARVTVGVDLNG